MPPSATRGTAFEGTGDPARSIESWQFLLKLLKSGDANFLPGKLTHAQIDKVLDKLQNELLFFHSLTSNIGLKPLTQEFLEDRAVTLRHLLLDKCARKGTAYMTLGYMNDGLHAAHVMDGKFSRDKNYTYVNLMNLGDGSSEHAVLDYSTAQDLVSYLYFPIRIPNHVFDSDLGKSALIRAIRYLNEHADPSCAAYSGEEIYDIFLSIGEVVPDLGPYLDSLKSTHQTDGDCPEQAVKNVIRDVLINEGVDVNTIEETFVNLNLTSLIQAYQVHLKAPTPYSGVFLNRAAVQFGITFEAMKQNFSPEEKIAVSGVVHEIVKKTKNTQAPLLVNNPLAPLPNFVIAPLNATKPLKITAVPEAFPSPDMSKVKSLHTHSQPVAAPSTPWYVIPRFDPKNLLNDINLWIDVMDTLPEDEAFILFI